MKRSSSRKALSIALLAVTTGTTGLAPALEATPVVAQSRAGTEPVDLETEVPVAALLPLYGAAAQVTEELDANVDPPVTRADSSSADRPLPAPGPEPAATNLESITVTGTRIRGGTTPSPVITIGAENIREEGFTNLGQVIRAVPQNFKGGQNPGVIGVSGSVSSQDLTGGSALNLRGLGPDASLTLLNGRRLAYDGFAQAVDISAIPVEAVERLEIVPDGASAIYGSDAVGGVANVILVRDFDGVAVGARYGGATDGGLATREYTATAGAAWASGGLIVALKDTVADPISAHQRNYTDHLISPYTIYNGWNSRNGLISFHQSVGDVAELRLDTLRTDRDTTQHVTQPGSYQQYASDAAVVLVSPSIQFFLPRDWSLTVGGAYGKNESAVERHLVSAAGSSLVRNTGYYNRSRSFEIGAEGLLFAMGGGDARLAIGLGARTDDFLQLNQISDVGFGGDERARYAYTELNLPLVSPSSGTAGIRRLAFSAAIRGEDYDSFGRVTTPKLGVIYDPTADLTLKASWGKSFKAPTLNQRYLDKTAYLWTAPAAGGSGYPAGATVLMSYGGNSDLHAERAQTWTASLAVHPEALPGLETELTVFDVDYTDRVVEPINYRLALSNPAYAGFVDYSPTPEQQAELLAVYNSAFYNLSGAAYDPDNVVAIIRDQFVNAARQRVRGVDLSGSYGFGLGNGRLVVRGSASWLKSTQQTAAGQPENDLAGTVFNPAKLNGRIGAVWTSGGFSASGFANYTSGVTDRLAAISEKTASFTTVDATLSYDTDARAGAFSGLTLGLSVQNLLNREPPLYIPRDANFVPYDATNYSAIGRFASVSVSKRW
ncbi:TonB-dependent receptor [Pseudoxanthomonas wuyuanensis]